MGRPKKVEAGLVMSQIDLPDLARTIGNYVIERLRHEDLGAKEGYTEKPRLVSLKEFCHLIGDVSEWFVLREVAAGRIAAKKVGNRFKFEPSEADKYNDACPPARESSRQDE